MLPRAPAIVLLCAAVPLGACGGGSDEPAATAPPAQRSAPVVPGGSLALPRAVPRRASRTGDPAAIKVIRLWTEALRRSDVERASALGARNSFTIAVFKLTNRPGADCGSGVGHDARTAILVRAGRIAEWYRLPDDPDAPAPAPGAPAPAPEPPAAPLEPDGPII